MGEGVSELGLARVEHLGEDLAREARVLARGHREECVDLQRDGGRERGIAERARDKILTQLQTRLDAALAKAYAYFMLFLYPFGIPMLYAYILYVRHGVATAMLCANEG